MSQSTNAPLTLQSKMRLAISHASRPTASRIGFSGLAASTVGDEDDADLDDTYKMTGGGMNMSKNLHAKRQMTNKRTSSKW